VTYPDKIDALVTRIDDLLDTLSRDELLLVIKRAKTLLGRPGRKETARGRSEEPYHQACDAAALEVRELKRIWLEDHPNERGVPEKTTEAFINEEIARSDLLKHLDDSDGRIHSAILDRIHDSKLKGK
jgi:hypothetical protein